MVILPTEKRIDWNRPPFIVLALVVINAIIFIISNGHDNRTYQKTLDYYHTQDMLDREWPAYVDFRLKANDISEQELDAIKDDQPYLAYELMTFDPEFHRYLQETISFYTTSAEEQNRWLEQRQTINDYVNSLSARAFGMNTGQFSVVDVFSHQFLHGGWSHLIGNMIFLLICGFAVEASLGSRRFLLFYLIGGAGGGLFYYLMHQLFSSGTTYLVGASGAISAVLAMYVTLFRLQKIEFFYWLYIFVGYFKAPAIWLLPFYIFVELIQWLTSDSNVAYTAHIGGFISGYLLILYLNRYGQQTIDTDYIEQDQAVDQSQQKLDRVYRAIADYNFERALSLLDPLLDPSNTELMKIKLNLVRALGDEQKHQFLLECVQNNIRFDRLDDAIEQWWLSLPESEQKQIDGQLRAQIAMRLIGQEHYKPCEAIVDQLLVEGFREPILGKLARRLAHFYERQGVINKRNELNGLADSLMQAKSLVDGPKSQG